MHVCFYAYTYYTYTDLYISCTIRFLTAVEARQGSFGLLVGSAAEANVLLIFPMFVCLCVCVSVCVCACVCVCLCVCVFVYIHM